MTIKYNNCTSRSWICQSPNHSERMKHDERTEHYGGHCLFFPNPLTLICSLNEDGTTNWPPSALSPISLSTRRWWDSPPESSPTPASVCGRLEKSLSRSPVKVWAGAVMACGTSTGAKLNKVAENHIEMKSVDGSDIQIPADTRLAMAATLQQSVEVGDHILHICQVDKFLGDEDKKGLYAWNGFGKVASAAEG